jgi:hypothetical protein
VFTSRTIPSACGWGLLCLVPAGTCVAQSDPPVTITYHLTFTEVSAQAPYAPVASPNGLIEPGEGARFEINASMSPPPGTAITYSWTYLAGMAGAGYVGGFWSGDLNLIGEAGTAAAAGTWVINQNTSPSANPNRLGVLPPFAAGFPTASGNVNANGSGLTDIQPAQFGADSGLLNSASPTEPMWRGLWIPASHIPRSATFELSLGSLGLASYFFAVDNSVTLPISLSATSNYPLPLQIQIVPAPGAAVLLLLMCTRRRRRLATKGPSRRAQRM